MDATMILALSTLMAAAFVAVQAWYARIAYVEASATRLLEDKLDLCFVTFDEAAALDAALRRAVPGIGQDGMWPPHIETLDVSGLARIQRDVVPRLDALESALVKAMILGDLDRFRAYLAQELSGLSKTLLDIAPARIAEPEIAERLDGAVDTLSEFIGAQYPVMAGCRLIAEGEV